MFTAPTLVLLALAVVAIHTSLASPFDKVQNAEAIAVRHGFKYLGSVMKASNDCGCKISYYESVNSAGWERAKADCKTFSVNSSLATPNSAEEMKDLFEFVESSGGIGNLYWVGGKHGSNRQVVWIYDSGNTVAVGNHIPWAAGEPKLVSQRTDRLLLNMNGGDPKFQIGKNSRPERFLCQEETCS